MSNNLQAQWVEWVQVQTWGCVLLNHFLFQSTRTWIFLAAAGRWDEGGVMGFLTAGCFLSSPNVSSGRRGWLPGRQSGCVRVSGNGSVCCVPAGTALWTPWAETAYCGACRWTRPQAAWTTAGRIWEVSAEARPRCHRRPAAGEREHTHTRVSSSRAQMQNHHLVHRCGKKTSNKKQTNIQLLFSVHI